MSVCHAFLLILFLSFSIGLQNLIFNLTKIYIFVTIPQNFFQHVVALHVSRQPFIHVKLYPKDKSSNFPLHVEPVCPFQHHTWVWKQRGFGAHPKTLHTGYESLPAVISSLPDQLSPPHWRGAPAVHGEGAQTVPLLQPLLPAVIFLPAVNKRIRKVKHN